jgi:hypothetical protein
MNGNWNPRESGLARVVKDRRSRNPPALRELMAIIDGIDLDGDDDHACSDPTARGPGTARLVQRPSACGAGAGAGGGKLRNRARNESHARTIGDRDAGA